LQHGPFNESFTVCEDYDLWLKILAHEKIGFLPEFVANKYGGHTDQLSTKFPAMDYWRIKSLAELLSRSLSDQQKEMVVAEIKKKAPVLMAGFQKHQQHERLAEMKELISELL
ncbi:MAG: glycosyl transferase, partial [Bdellovibrionales bacterium]|nr:glycosyl transferase [Bdellovibrionales bacterium]